MKKNNLLFVIICFVILTGNLSAQQYDFKDGVFFYKITDATAKTVSIVPELATVRMIFGTQEIQAFYSDATYVAIHNAAYVVNGNFYELVVPSKATNAGTEYTVTELGQNVFYGFWDIRQIYLPNTLQIIGTSALGNMKYIESLTIPASVTTIGVNAFYRLSSITELIIPNSVKTIGDYAFYKCGNLTTLNLPEGLESLGAGVCRDNTKLTTINLPSTLTKIGNAAFMYCSKITSITIPNGITTIETATFKGCYALNTVVIGSGVTTINDEAFYICTALASITSLPVTPPVVNGYTAFVGVPQKVPAQKISSLSNVVNAPNAPATLYVPAGSVDAYKAANTWKNFVNIVGIATGLSKLEDVGVKVWTGKNSIYLSGVNTNAENVQIYNAAGKLVYTQKITSADMSVSISSGVYVVRVQNGAQKVIVR